MKRYLVALLLAQVAHATIVDDIRAIRRQIERLTPSPAVAEKIRLPTSRFFDQSETNLCWVYATLSALESNDRVTHPGSDLELSRTQLQYVNWEDRYQREIELGDHYVRETGTTVDAISLIRRFGLVARGDYSLEPRILPVDHPFQIPALPLIVPVLDRELGALPNVTFLNHQAMSPLDFADAVLGDAQWEAYGWSDDNSEGYRDHWDPDARRETQAYFLPKQKFAQAIHRSLQAGHALAISLCGHDIEMYGADFDAQGTPLTYYVKDSVGEASDAFYTIDPERARASHHLCGVSTIKLAL